jgi:hypothetical protein
MSLDQATIKRLVKLDSPILCVDTCALLDVIRDITDVHRDFTYVGDGLLLLEAAESSGKLTVLMSDVVSRELTENASNEEQRASERLKDYLENAERIHKIATAYGANGTLQIDHIDGHVPRAMTIFDRWKNISMAVPLNDGVHTRASKRAYLGLSPAKIGKESLNDCRIFEAYIELAGQLRSEGLQARMVFISSNTKEYREPSKRILKADIGEDLAKVSLEYAANFGEAKHRLGL